MATLSSLGVGAGFDTESLVTKLVSLEKAPAEKILSETTKLNTKLSTWGRVQSSFSALKDAASALNKDSFWNATTATSSDSATSAGSCVIGRISAASSVPEVKKFCIVPKVTYGGHCRSARHLCHLRRFRLTP